MWKKRTGRWAWSATLLCGCVTVGCSDGALCAAGMEQMGGRCVSSHTRYEPDERVDEDNVISYSGEPTLDLPEPPKSGFRLVVPPRMVAPGEELTPCVSWPFPDIDNTLVYSARLYTSPGLHHANVFSNLPDAELGENPYPDCHPGAQAVFAQISQGVPDVLFANSTQVLGGEWLTFPAGMAYRVQPEREIIADVHFFNTTSEPIWAEVVYDFYTMPEAELREELVPFAMDNRAFEVPPQQTETASADCEVWDGNVVSLMPHTHDYSQRFTVELINAQGDAEMIYEEAGFDLESDVQVFDPAVSLQGVDRIRFACTFTNTKTTPLIYGLGDNEMCVLFGYMYPAHEQFASYQVDAEEGCVSVKLQPSQ